MIPAGLVWLDCARALLVAWLAVLLAGMLRRPSATPRSPLGWTALLAPWLMPSLLVSFAYAPVFLALAGKPLAAHGCYSLMQLIRLAPLATVILLVLPAPLDRSASFIHRSLALGSWARLRFALRQADPAPLTAGFVVFLAAFTDFELATLWSLRTWPVRLFDAHAGGLDLARSLELAALPLAIQCVALSLLALISSRTVSWLPQNPPPASHPHLCTAYLAGALLVGTIIPLAHILLRSMAGLGSIARHFALTREILISLGFALAAGALAHLGAARSRSLPRALGVVATLPGLLGGLILSLLVLAAFQLPLLRPFYDSPLPLILCLGLLLLPWTLPLRWLRAARRPGAAIHLAEHSVQPGRKRAHLLWQLRGRVDFLVAALPFFVGYFDFTASAILAPVALPPVFPRLHNLAHYGQNAVLSAMLLASTILPLLLASVFAIGCRLRGGSRLGD